MSANNKRIGVILGAGRVHDSLLPLFGDIPSALIPVNGRPSIAYICEQFKQLDIQIIYLIVGYKQEMVKNWFDGMIDLGIELHYVTVDSQRKPGSSLNAAIRQIHRCWTHCSVLVSTADTIIYNMADLNLDLSRNFVLVSPKYNFSELWCTAEYDADTQELQYIFDKVPNKDGLAALVGVYNFADIQNFKELKNFDEDVEISAIIKEYQQFYPISCITADKWYDLGHLDRYYQARRDFLSHRFFNNFSHDYCLGTIRKKSNNREKLKGELAWIKSLPPEISVLAPRVLEFNLNAEQEAWVEMEYYAYPPLAELWLYGDLGYFVWKDIIDRLVGLLNIFSKYRGAVDRADYYNIYVEKTLSRICKACSGNALLNQLFAYTSLCIGNKEYLGWPALKDWVMEKTADLYNQHDNCLIHGDLCFSNILYDVHHGIIRLIDPRGHWSGKNFLRRSEI